MILTLLAAAVVGTVCVLSRWYLEEKTPRKGQEHWWEFHPFYNSGAAFGWKRLEGKGLIAACLASAAGLLALAASRRRPLPRLGAGLALGGGLSNLWERVRHGTVFDYIRFPKLPGKGNRFIYNLADFAIFGGAALLLLDAFREKGEERKR